MRRILLIVITLFTGFNAVAQDTAANKSEKKVKLNFYGDINPQIYAEANHLAKILSRPDHPQRAGIS